MKDWIWNFLLGRVKCGDNWLNMLEEYLECRYRAACVAAGCKERPEDGKTDMVCNDQAPMADLCIGITRGIGALTFSREGRQ